MIADPLYASLRDGEYRVFYRPQDNPLETFYLPTLSASVHYDRSAGYFRSSALAAAAAGIVRLIQNGGRMRLLVGAELSEPDVAAIKKGYSLRETLEKELLGAFPDPGAGPLRQRLEALAWMVANDTLDIKVVLPLDSNGHPIPGPEAHDYYHTKKGIFTDAHGHQVGFVGSVNESAQAWKHNFEEFSVYLSWEGERDRAALGSLRISFNDLWEGHDPHWVAVALPQAVKERLIKYAPSRPPTTDALERPSQRGETAEGAPGFAAVSPDERLLFQFLRDAPTLPPSAVQDLGAQTSAIAPWPHQIQVARTIIARFPDRVLLCDEVGLGKTIEAGLVIRQLILTGRAKRCLILTPAVVLRQWQEELYEKFNLDIPRFDAGQVRDIRDQAIALTDNPWDSCDVLLASSHLAKRKERVAQLLDAPPWDLLVVDEAHHARRRDFLQPRYRPNRLLTLLNALKETERFAALMLLTATPMQVHPVEVWDLLTVLGLGGQWGADEANFLEFFAQLRRPFEQTRWDFVYDLVADALALGDDLDPQFVQMLHAKLGPALADAVCALPRRRETRQATLRSLPPTARPYVRELARAHTPLRRAMFRNTRALLRKYAADGLLQATIPWREPHICRIDFRADEAELYARITEYISDFYQRYENQRRGLGFIMTVYRRRLTSSFYAVRRSLERRRDVLRGLMNPDELLTPEDTVETEDQAELEEAEQAFFEALELTATQRENFQRELEYLDGFIADLRALSPADSKLTYLKDALERLFRQRQTVLVFTQYTDTMDYLRDQLGTVYGSGVACYSGRGGEVWNGIAWIPVPKEKVKARFRDGDLRILLCTESASEGLNLQTCGVLINYDMPWNPMRVEQRIGRIDRIGQEFEKVWIYNYFYKDSIEDRIYQALKDRIHWFEDVVGDLQPILAQVEQVTRKLAMLATEEQEAALRGEIQRLRAEIETARRESLNLTEYLDPERPDATIQAPVTLADLEATLTQAAATAGKFTPHPEIPDAYLLAWEGHEIPVTFSAARFDEYPDTLQFLSYGAPLLADLLASVAPPEAYPPHLARFEDDALLPVRAWYDVRGSAPHPVDSLAALKHSLARSPAPPASAAEDTVERARQHFAAQVQTLNRAHQQRLVHYTTRRKATLQARARRLLEKAALIEICLGQQQTLFAQETYPTSFDESAVAGLARHKSPWSWLLVISDKPLPRPQPTDPFYAESHALKHEALQARFAELTAEAEAVRKAWRALPDSPQKS